MPKERRAVDGFESLDGSSWVGIGIGVGFVDGVKIDKESEPMFPKKSALSLRFTRVPCLG